LGQSEEVESETHSQVFVVSETSMIKAAVTVTVVMVAMKVMTMEAAKVATIVVVRVAMVVVATLESL
jgi:hypothetical protein